MIRPLAGQSAPASALIGAGKLVPAHHKYMPDPTVAKQRGVFGTSGHRGSAIDRWFKAWHVLVIAQAFCHYRRAHGIGGPLFMGIDSHALSA